MTGLADAYQDDVGALQSHTRLKAGVGLLVLGTLLCLLALVFAVANPTAWGARRLAGAFVGLAAPALAGGVVVILPASPRLRAAAAIGASLTVLGVAAFWRAYPEHWMGHGRELTPYVTGIYFLGMLTVALCLFAGIATLKRRNDPGGTVSLVVGEGETKIVEVESDGGLGGLGGVGFLGGTPEGDVETQTNRPQGASSSDTASSGATARTSTTRDSSPRGSATSAGSGGAGRSRTPGARGQSAGSDTGTTGTSGSSAGASGGAGGSVSTGGRFQSSTPTASESSTAAGGHSSGPAAGSGTSTSREHSAVSDGGSSGEQLRTPETDVTPGTSPGAADQYCGNCEHFSYVRTEDGMTPHCGHTSEYMEDMEACEDWSPNAGGR